MEKKSAENLVLARELNEWVDEFGCKNEITTELAKALESKKDLHKWADLDPFEFLPIPLLKVASKKSALVDNLTILRNVLVFSPVALTWAAVGQATEAFEVFLENNDTGVVNFLEFWQNGYDILPKFWRIGDVARHAYWIILAVIILTLIVSYLSKKLARFEGSETTRMEDQRQFIATKIALFLVDKKKITNVTFNQSLAGSVQRLSSATVALDKTTKELNKASKRLPKIDQ